MFSSAAIKLQIATPWQVLVFPGFPSAFPLLTRHPLSIPPSRCLADISVMLRIVDKVTRSCGKFYLNFQCICCRCFCFCFSLGFSFFALANLRQRVVCAVFAAALCGWEALMNEMQLTPEKHEAPLIWLTSFPNCVFVAPACTHQLIMAPRAAFLTPAVPAPAPAPAPAVLPITFCFINDRSQPQKISQAEQFLIIMGSRMPNPNTNPECHVKLVEAILFASLDDGLEAENPHHWENPEHKDKTTCRTQWRRWKFVGGGTL